MVDIARTKAELLTLFADNASGDISAQDGRDFIQSADITGMLYRDTRLTNAQLLNLVASPVEMIPAPGPGFFTQVDNGIGWSSFAAGAYGIAGISISFAFDIDIGGTPLSNGIIGWDTAIDKSQNFFKSLDPNAGGPASETPNLALTLVNTGANLTGGNVANSFSMRLYYRILPAAPFG